VIASNEAEVLRALDNDAALDVEAMARFLDAEQLRVI
jgi:hypothetical protein